MFKFKQTPQIVLEGDINHAEMFVQLSLINLDILLHGKKFRELKQDTKSITYSDGTRIDIMSTFGENKIRIFSPWVIEAEKLEEEEETFTIKLLLDRWMVILDNPDYLLDQSELDENELSYIKAYAYHEHSSDYDHEQDLIDISYEFLGNGTWGIKFPTKQVEGFWLVYSSWLGLETQYPLKFAIDKTGQFISYNRWAKADLVFLKQNMKTTLVDIMPYIPPIWFDLTIDGNALTHGGQILSMRFTNKAGDSVTESTTKVAGYEDIPTYAERVADPELVIGRSGRYYLRDVNVGEPFYIGVNRETRRDKGDYEHLSWSILEYTLPESIYYLSILDDFREILCGNIGGDVEMCTALNASYEQYDNLADMFSYVVPYNTKYIAENTLRGISPRSMFRCWRDPNIYEDIWTIGLMEGTTTWENIDAKSGWNAANDQFLEVETIYEEFDFLDDIYAQVLEDAGDYKLDLDLALNLQVVKMSSSIAGGRGVEGGHVVECPTTDQRLYLNRLPLLRLYTSSSIGPEHSYEHEPFLSQAWSLEYKDAWWPGVVSDNLPEMIPSIEVTSINDDMSLVLGVGSLSNTAVSMYASTPYPIHVIQELTWVALPNYYF